LIGMVTDRGETMLFHAAAFWLVVCLALLGELGIAAETTGVQRGRWWPVQATPDALVRLNPAGFPVPGADYDMLAQSVAGLAAQAVNEGRGSELVWVDGGEMYEEWLRRRLADQPHIEMRGAVDIWELISRYQKQGIIKGYILYRADASEGEINQHRPGMDCSVNVATSLAGILGGVMVEEKLELAAKEHGLTLIIDVRDKTQAWCFETYKDRFNRRMVCTQDPRKPHTRDLAVTQRAFTMYGYDEPMASVMEWLEPLSPVLGWNGGDEFKTTEISSHWGHIQTATDWCCNLPVLMAGSEKASSAKIPPFDPQSIDWHDKRSGVAFVGTDGDNVQWLLGNFYQAGEQASYWGSPHRGRIPFGWSHCFSELVQLCPETVDFAISTQAPTDSLVEWGGGYYYPDLFGLKRPDRWELLAEQARRTWRLMEQNNSQMIGFNCADYASADARKAYEVIASQTDGLLAILVFQYAPYEAGAGETFWVKDNRGVELPVITARYSIWEHSNSRPRSGTPAKVAREIVESVDESQAHGSARYDWVIAHVWSYFKEAPGEDENAENMDQSTATSAGGVRGYLPVVWCAERLPSTIRVMSTEEMAWRIRMEHDPAATEQLINPRR
jgi:hypothetical protein